MFQRMFWVLLVAIFSNPAWVEKMSLPTSDDSLKFAVIGDSGTGTDDQINVGQRLWESRSKFPFEFVLMLGDNIYGGERERDFSRKFEYPYQQLLSAGVKFYAALGNHDNVAQTKYKLFNMDGNRYYTFRPKSGVRFFALDSNYLDRAQIDWLEKELKGSKSDWKVCFFHHPLYSSGRKHGSALELRKVLEPLFLKYGVDVVFAGHEHFYERLKPQKGIHYFISGGAGKLRRGDIQATEITAKGFDRDNHFMLIEIAGDKFHYEVISRKGDIVDSGSFQRKPELTQTSG